VLSDIRWTREAIAYQIFPDRFCRGASSRIPESAERWGSKPTARGFMGGNLSGITRRLDYLEELGVNLLYLTPIFESPSNHGYDTSDYYTVEPRLGSEKDLQILLSLAHVRGMRILLDGVFNHCGRGFVPFRDVLENGFRSRYRDWFHFYRFPASDEGSHEYRAFQDAPGMPVFNLRNPETREFLLEVGQYWTRQGIDGWRLDAVGESEDRVFWREFRRVVKAVNPRAYIIAEIWKGGGEEDAFDGVTNYPLRETMLEFFLRRSIRASHFAASVDRLFSDLTRSSVPAMFNIVGSHDTERIMTLAGGDLDRVMLIHLFLFCCPGVPAVYYGDEIGLEGGKDPDNRRAMSWDPRTWNHDLWEFTRRLIAVRRSVDPLRHGDWRTLFADDKESVCAFLKRADGRAAVVVVSSGDRPITVAIDLSACGLDTGTVLLNVMDGRIANRTVSGRSLCTLRPRSGAILIPDRE